LNIFPHFCVKPLSRSNHVSLVSNFRLYRQTKIWDKSQDKRWIYTKILLKFHLNYLEHKSIYVIGFELNALKENGKSKYGTRATQDGSTLKFPQNFFLSIWSTIQFVSLAGALRFHSKEYYPLPFYGIWTWEPGLAYPSMVFGLENQGWHTLL